MHSTLTPVTIVTGALGAGKTTLVNHLLASAPDRRFGVVENELGAVGIDSHLLHPSAAAVVETCDGRLCCTARCDLTCSLHRFDGVDLDGILVETTGLADPAGVLGAFVRDRTIRQRFRLDAIVTVVDAVHVESQLASLHEARRQIAMADVLILNKTDTVSPSRTRALAGRLARLNPDARVIVAQQGQVAAPDLVDIRRFRFSRALSIDRCCLEPRHEFGWAGVYRLEPGPVVIALPPGQVRAEPLHLLDPSRDPLYQPGTGREFELAALPCADPERGLELILTGSPHAPVHGSPRVLSLGEPLEPGRGVVAIATSREGAARPIRVPHAGLFALFARQPHRPGDFTVVREGRPITPVFTQDFCTHHLHDSRVEAVSLVSHAPMDQRKLLTFLCDLMVPKAAEILRVKGFVALSGQREPYVVQGVQRAFTGRANDLAISSGPRSAIVVIGRKLHADAMQRRFAACTP